MSLDTTTRKCAISDAGASICATQLNDPDGFTISTRGKNHQSNNKVVLRFDDLSKRNINVINDEQGSPKADIRAIVGSSDIISGNPVESTDLLSCFGRELIPTDVSFPLPPYICTRFNPLLEEMLEKIVNLHSIVRRHSHPSSLSTSFDGKSSSSPFIDSSSDIVSLPRVDSLTIETERETKKSSKNRPLLRRVHESQKKNDTNYSSSSNSSGSSSFLDSLSLEEENSPDDFLSRLLDDDHIPELSKPFENKSNLDKTRKHDVNSSSETCRDVEVDNLASFLDDILDIKEEKKEDILKVERQYPQEQQQEQQNVNRSPIVLTPSNSTTSVFTTDNLLLHVGDSTPVVAHDNVGSHSSSKITAPIPFSSTRGKKMTREDYMKFLQICVDSLLQLRDFMATRIKHVQNEVDTYYSRCCDCVSSADLAKKQSKLNEAVKKLCSQTDRLNTTQLLLRQEKSRLQFILKLSERNTGYSTQETNSMYEQTVPEVVGTDEDKLSNTVDLASSPVECFCRIASPLHSTNLLARDVLSHRRQLSRLVEIFRACPEAVEQWALMLYQEADACHAELEKIFWDSQKEKEKLLNAFEIISWDDL